MFILGGVKIQRITAPRKPTNFITTTSWRSGQETVKKVLGPAITRPKSKTSPRPQSNASHDTTSTSSRLEKLEWKKDERDKIEKLSTPVEDMEIKWEMNGIEKKEDEMDSEEDDIKEKGIHYTKTYRITFIAMALSMDKMFIAIFNYMSMGRGFFCNFLL